MQLKKITHPKINILCQIINLIELSSDYKEESRREKGKEKSEQEWEGKGAGLSADKSESSLDFLVEWIAKMERRLFILIKKTFNYGVSTSF